MKKIILAAALFSALFASCSRKNTSVDTRLAVEDGKTVVERYGNLQVIGTRLCDQNGNPVQLRGMSSHGLQWHGKYANKNVIEWLRDDWNCQVWRAAMYVTEGGYANSKAIQLKLIESVEAALKLGIYVIVDWHILANGDPLAHKDLAVEFFDGISKKYGQYPNVIYEICNEPNGDNVTWSGNIKPYAQEIVAAIRKNDPDNIIVCGTPHWDQEPDKAAVDMLEGSNIMYTLHFYAGSHGANNMKAAKRAIKKGAPLFVTEWGTTRESGDGGVFVKETKKWLRFLEDNGISWVNWSVNNKGEDSGTLKYNADRDGKGHWTEDQLSESGKFVRKIMRNEEPLK